MKLCDTCIYRNNVEQLKPCIIYRDNCEFYEKERGDMTREEAIEQLEKAYKECVDLGQTCGKDSVFWKRAEAIKVAIKALEQEPKTGHWIPRNSFLLQYKCSECEWDSEKYNYCPNCGAKMFELQESEE